MRPAALQFIFLFNPQQVAGQALELTQVDVGTWCPGRLRLVVLVPISGSLPLRNDSDIHNHYIKWLVKGNWQITKLYKSIYSAVLVLGCNTRRKRGRYA